MYASMDVSDHSGHADYEWFITLNRVCLRLLGIWPEKDRRKKWMTDAYVIIILTIIIWSSAIPTFHSLIRIWGDISSMIDNLQYSLPLLISVIKLVVMWQKRKVLIPFLEMVEEDWTKLKTGKERTIMVRRAQTARLIMIWGYFVMFVSFILVVIFPSFGVSLRYLTNITDPDRLMPLQSYYMYNVNDSPFYEIIFLLQGFSLMVAATIYTGTDTFMGFLIFHVCGQLENLRARILDLKFNCLEDSLSSNIREHIRLIRSIKIIDDTFTLMLLGLLVYFGILFALYGFLFVTIMTQGRNLSIARLIYIMTSFINTFTHMCLHCVVGEFLVIQCNGIYEAVCQYKWYNVQPRQARNLLIMMIQAKRPLYLTAGKLFPMTMATFCSLLKTSGSYISVLLAHRT
ncbi:odorant receptor 43a-like isoform X3 [Polyergus mexicanus]|uniref:odorant receptor 43a-like isoform X3 n=1 Tax=Polyergus mexicanus TaxID=615972 RepID=UPI0038B67BA6